jgi:hypothetical protein
MKMLFSDVMVNPVESAFQIGEVAFDAVRAKISPYCRICSDSSLRGSSIPLGLRQTLVYLVIPVLLCTPNGEKR